MRKPIALVTALLLMASCNEEAGNGDGEMTDDDRIANAISAAPAAMGRQATVIAFDEEGRERTLRRGSGDFTCYPDDPATPGNDPMCFDRNGLAWASAWMGRESPPPAGRIGVAYMLRGSWAASNENPYATAPDPGDRWVETGPALMILNVRGWTTGFPREPDDPGRPFVMWPDTPYEHLMVPLGGSMP